MSRSFDVIVWGATGFTGKLVCEYLLRTYGTGKDLKWAMAGRSQDKLDQLNQELGASIPTLIANSNDRLSLDALVGKTAVICTTVGPYARYGSELVAACVSAGTHYCDLSGEVPWMHEMIKKHQQDARNSGARIVHCCGFDSIPSDMGVYFLQKESQQRFGQPAARIRMRVRVIKGGASGGTIASMLNIVKSAREDRSVAKLLYNPYSLNPPDAMQGPDKPDMRGAQFDRDFDAWIAPFVMGSINSRVVRRSNAVGDWPYGKDFSYNEAMLMGRGFKGRMRAMTTSAGLSAFVVGAAMGPTRALMQKFMLPEPGEGPNEHQRENGYYDLRFHGETADGKTIRVKVTGDRDPGYGSTSKMLGESAVCLARDLSQDENAVGGGFWTPATALGDSLLERLQANAGLTFEVLD